MTPERLCEVRHVLAKLASPTWTYVGKSSNGELLWYKPKPSPDSVARKLHSLGIRGGFHCDTCPVWQFLHWALPWLRGHRVEVYPHYLVLQLAADVGSKLLDHDLGDFIRQHDRGEYPFLLQTS